MSNIKAIIQFIRESEDDWLTRAARAGLSRIEKEKEEIGTPRYPESSDTRLKGPNTPGFEYQGGKKKKAEARPTITAGRIDPFELMKQDPAPSASLCVFRIHRDQLKRIDQGTYKPWESTTLHTILPDRRTQNQMERRDQLDETWKQNLDTAKRIIRKQVDENGGAGHQWIITVNPPHNVSNQHIVAAYDEDNDDFTHWNESHKPIGSYYHPETFSSLEF